jgi:hypothetical protein
MRTGETKNLRKFGLASLATVDDGIETMPAAPFGALVIAPDDEIPLKDFAKLATRLLESGCAFATLFTGDKRIRKLHQVFDKAVVDHQLKRNPDADMATGGEPEDSLEEAVREAIHNGQPTYGDPFAELLILVIGDDPDKLAEKAESLAKSVEAD